PAGHAPPLLGVAVTVGAADFRLSSLASAERRAPHRCLERKHPPSAYVPSGYVSSLGFPYDSASARAAFAISTRASATGGSNVAMNSANRDGMSGFSKHSATSTTSPMRVTLCG